MYDGNEGEMAVQLNDGDSLVSYVATDSDAVMEVTLDVIHADLQLLHFSILSIFCILFVMFCVRKWR